MNKRWGGAGGAGAAEPAQAAKGYGRLLDGDSAGKWTDGSGRRPFLRVTIAIVFLFWTAQFSLLTTIVLIRTPQDAVAYAAPRALVTALGMAISVAMLVLQLRARNASLLKRSLLAAWLGVVGALLHGAANEGVFVALGESQFSTSDYTVSVLWNMWTYLSMSVILLALTYAMDLRERENRISALRTVAQAAQLRALRFQLNPHFLFNALNSVASLIAKDRNREAESMTVALSDFLRSTMRMDPEGEIELGEEIAMQSRYLEIEKARFPKRLIVELDVPPELRKAAIPNLISQPLVENAVKYAVARSSAPVTLRIAAWEEDGVLALCVRDDGGDAAQPATGTNIGLSNVSERLRLHFGDAASLVAGALAGGGYEAVIRVPLRIEQ